MQTAKKQVRPVRLRTDAPVSRAPAVLRAMGIVQLLSRSKTPLTLSQMASAMGVLSSSCLNILRELVKSALVVRDEATKQYSLGPESLILAHRYLMQNRLARAGQTELERLQRAHGLTAVLSQRHGELLLCIGVSRGALAGAFSVPIGQWEQFYASAAGRVALSLESRSDGELRQIHGALPWQLKPPLKTWVDDIRAARTSGYAMDCGNYIRTGAFIAVPIVTDEGQLRGTLSLAMAKSLMADFDMTTLAEDMKVSAGNIVVVMGTR